MPYKLYKKTFCSIGVAVIFSLICAILLFSCIGDSKRKRQLGEEATLQKAFQMYHSDDWTERKAGIRELKNLPPKKKRSPSTDNSVIIFLIAASCEDPYSLVRIEAVNGLAEYLYDKRAFECLRKIALAAKNTNIRWMALEVLANNPKIESLDIFIINSSNKDSLIRETAVKGMLKVRDEGVESKILPYVKMALRDPAIGVKTTALENLYFRDESLYVIISAFVKDDKIPLILLASALKAIEGYSLDAETQDRIIPFLVHNNKDIRLLALRALQNQKN